MPSQPFFQRYAARRRFMRAVLAGRAPAWYNTFRTNIFSNAETLCPPGSLSQCKALQKQTQENAPMCSIKIIIVDKNWR
jgi:hypothetical protein